MRLQLHLGILVPLTLLTFGCVIYVSTHSHSLINRCFGWTSLTVIPMALGCSFVGSLWVVYLHATGVFLKNSGSPETRLVDSKADAAEPGWSRWLTIIWIVLGSVSMVLLVGTLAFYAYLFSSGARGVYAGSLTVSGLSAPVTVQRDADGVTHVTASSLPDLFFAQGYAVAQDRLWQLEFTRRAARGELAAALGTSALSTDILIRTLGIPFSANESYVNDLTPGSTDKMLLDQYVAGINAYIGGTPALTPEFVMLGVRPGLWTGPDVVAAGLLTFLTLARNSNYELLRWRLLQRGLSIARVDQLLPAYPSSAPTIVQQADWNTTAAGGAASPLDSDEWQTYYMSVLSNPDMTSAERDAVSEEWKRTDATVQAIAAYVPGIRSIGASNGWVVSGAYTATGKPLLANDPHLPLNSPNVWWMTHLKCTACSFEVFGTSYVGLPGILIGRNRNISWGLTMGMADEQDLFIMTENADGTQYYHNNAWVPYTVRTESISVKGAAAPTTLSVKVSRYGPVINSAYNVPGTTNLCLFWSSFNQSALIGRTILSLLNATNHAGFLNAFSQYSGASLSVVYADTVGNIGYLLAGRFPLRQSQHDGRYPVPGNGTFDYVGWLPFAKNPQTLNPASGYIVAANNKSPYNGYPYNIGADWIPPLRAIRITQRLSALVGVTPVTIAHMQSIQLDTQSLIFDLLRSTFAAVQPSGPVAAAWQAATLLWDGNASIGSAKTGVFEAWLEEMLKLPAAETGVSLWSYNDIYYLVNLFGSSNATNALSDPACVAQGRTCMQFASTALDAAINTLGVAGSAGLQLPGWGGTVHAALFQHRIVSKSILGCMADRATYGRGDDFTVSVSHCGYGNGVLGVVTDGPSYRQVIDLSNMENSVYVCPLCGTGNMLAANYDSQLLAWGTGLYVSMRMDSVTPLATLTLQ